MKKYILALTFLLCIKSYSQTANPSLPAYIEVTGSAEMIVKPDVYFINLRIVTKLFNGISSQEKKVGNELTKVGIKPTDFSLTAISYDFRTPNMQSIERTRYWDYTLQIQTDKQLSDIFNALDEAGIEQASVSGIDYTKKDVIIKQLGINALKNASEKASNTLSSIGRNKARELSIIEEFSGPVTMANRLPSPYPDTQQPIANYPFDKSTFQRSYDGIPFRVVYRVQYSII